MSACAGMAKPIVSVISRSFLITFCIPTKNSKLGNGKLAVVAKNLSISLRVSDWGIQSWLERSKQKVNLILGSHRIKKEFYITVKKAKRKISLNM